MQNFNWTVNSKVYLGNRSATLQYIGVELPCLRVHHFNDFFVLNPIINYSTQ